MDLWGRGKDHNSSFPCFMINPWFSGFLPWDSEPPEMLVTFCVNMRAVFQVGYGLAGRYHTYIQGKIR